MSEGKRDSQARVLIGALCAALVLFSAGRVISWAQAERLSQAKIVEIAEATHLRKSSGVRREFVVSHEGRRERGRLTTYWGLGAPVEGEVVDLRIARDGDYSELYFDSWLRQFASTIIPLLVLGLIGCLLWWRTRSSTSPGSD